MNITQQNSLIYVKQQMFFIGLFVNVIQFSLAYAIFYIKVNSSYVWRILRIMNALLLIAKMQQCKIYFNKQINMYIKGTFLMCFVFTFKTTLVT